MRHIIASLILILVLGIAAFAQEEMIIADPISFDNFGKSSLNDEKGRFDNFFIALSKDVNENGVVIFQLDKNESKAKKGKRLRELSKFFSFRKIDKPRFTFIVYEDREELTVFWKIPKNNNWDDLLYFEDKNYKVIKGEEFEQKIDEMFPKK